MLDEAFPALLAVTAWAPISVVLHLYGIIWICELTFQLA